MPLGDDLFGTETTDSSPETAEAPPVRERTRPFSVRLTGEERSRLERAAGGEPLGVYVRSRLLDGVAPRRKVRGRQSIKDHEALARLLGELGRSRLSSNLNQLAKAANIGSLPVTPEIEAELRQACSAIREMRSALMAALGLREGSDA